MAKTKKVKWSLGSEEPEELQQFLTNDEIEDKHGRPPKGIYPVAVRRISVREIQSGDNAGEDRLNLMLVVSGATGDKKNWNGWLVWDGMNVTKQGSPFILRFLKALGLSWADFVERSKQNDEDPPQIVQIGKMKFGDEAKDDPIVRVNIKDKPNNQTGEMQSNVTMYLPTLDEDVEDDEDEDDDEPTAFVASEDEDEDDDVEDDDDDEDEDEDEDDDDDDDDEDDDEEDDDEEDEEDEDDEEEELRAELGSMKVANLQKRAARLVKKSKGVLDNDDVPTKKADLVDWLVENELTDPPF